jgi:hypothetical protein
MAQLSNKLPFAQMITKWAATLNPFLANPSLQSQIIPNVALVSGTNTINHGLGRNLVGWRIIRQSAVASLYDDQNSNTMPALTLQLVSNAAVTVSIEVF